MLNYKLILFIWNWSRGLWLILKTIIPLYSWTVRLQKGLLNMQTVCKRMDHCSNYLSMRIDLQRMHLLYVTHTHAHTSLTKPVAAFFSCVAVFHLICSSLGPASQRRAVVVVVVGRYSLHSLEIRVNSGNHFQLPSSDYFGALACHCEMGLGFSAAKKRKKKSLPLLSVVFWLLEFIGPESQDRKPKGSGTIAVVSVTSEWLWLFPESLKYSLEIYKSVKFKATLNVIGGRIETVLCWVPSSKTNQGSSSFCVIDWKRQGITYWWALVVQGETHASFKEIASYSPHSAFSDAQ